MSEKKTFLIHRNFGCYHIVKIGRKYHCVAHDPVTGITSAFIASDRVVGEFRKNIGWTIEAIQFVSKGHKLETAVNYFNVAMRKIRMAEKKEELVMCHWCNGSGMGPWGDHKCLYCKGGTVRASN